MDQITQEYLKSILDYNPDTGILTRLSNGKVAGSLKQTGYISFKIGNVDYSAHRIIWIYMTGQQPRECIDHINHIRHDNRWSNLREATYLENNKNKSAHHNNASGTIGVYFSKAMQKWHARITKNGKHKHIGYFTYIEDAIIARKKAEVEHNYHINHGG